MTPAERFEALLTYFNWDGGTIHQMANQIGLSVSEILYEELKAKEYSSVFLNSWRLRTSVANDHYGDKDFWHGVILGYNVALKDGIVYK